MGQMDNTRTTLLSLHRALVDFERRAYEKTHGRTSAGEFLQVLLRGGADSAFGGEYAKRVESSPDVAFAHAAALHALTGSREAVSPMRE